MSIETGYTETLFGAEVSRWAPIEGTRLWCEWDIDDHRDPSVEMRVQIEIREHPLAVPEFFMSATRIGCLALDRVGRPLIPPVASINAGRMTSPDGVTLAPQSFAPGTEARAILVATGPIKTSVRIRSGHLVGPGQLQDVGPVESVWP